MVRDTLTRLLWQQQASTVQMNRTAAGQYCSSVGLRLPTAKELRSLLDLTVGASPMINRTAFPDAPRGGFWTSTLGGNETAWLVDFEYGTSKADDMAKAFWVRCVQ